MSHKRSTGSQAAKLISTVVILGGLIYGTYNYFKENNYHNDVRSPKVKNNEKTEKTRKHHESRSISLVITRSILRSLDDDLNNETDESSDGEDTKGSKELGQYLTMYPNLTLILHPSVDKSQLLEQFEIDSESEHRIIRTTKEESIFHVMKQLGSSINLIKFDDINMNETEVGMFHLDRFLSNLIDLRGNKLDAYI